MLSVERLDVAYGGSQVVWSVDLDVPDGQVVCLMGRNGVGKTTVLRAIMGLLPARSGRITLDGQDITRWPSDRRARAGLGYVPQGREVFPHLSVEENLRMALLGCERATSIDDALDLFPPQVLAQIRERGVTVLLVEQYLDFAERLADTYVIMAKGSVVASGATKDLQVEVVKHHLAV